MHFVAREDVMPQNTARHRVPTRRLPAGQRLCGAWMKRAPTTLGAAVPPAGTTPLKMEDAGDAAAGDGDGRVRTRGRDGDPKESEVHDASSRNSSSSAVVDQW